MSKYCFVHALLAATLHSIIQFIATAEHANNPFCVDGRLAPSVFMIGTQKGGTTSLVADMLRQLPLSCGITLPNEPRKLWKEKHFFDNGECKLAGPAACYKNDSVLPEAGLEAARKHYFSHFPLCGSRSHHKRSSKEQVVPEGAASMDATPRYMRLPMASRRIMALYGPHLAAKLTLVVVLRDPETRAWSWYRFFALNACEGKPWAQDQLDKRFWFHFNNATFRRWVRAQIGAMTACKARGVPSNRMWPECDSETGMFAGFYSAQLKEWLDAGFRPDQLVVVPMDCYVGDGPAEAIRIISEAARLKVGKSIAEMDPKYQPENAKRLKVLVAGGNKLEAAAANRHAEAGIPLFAAKALKTFFRNEGEAVAQLLRDHPGVRVAECSRPHFFKPCGTRLQINGTFAHEEVDCLPSFDESVAKIDAAVVEKQRLHEVIKTEDDGTRGSLMRNGEKW